MMYIIIAAAAAAYALWKGVEVAEKVRNWEDVPDGIVEHYEVIQGAAEQFGVPVDIVAAVAWVESLGDQSARGSAGEYGIMQLKPIAVKDVRVEGFGEFPMWQSLAVDNVRAGAAFLALQYQRLQSWGKAIEAYNQGAVGRTQHPERAAEYRKKVEAKRPYFQ